MKIIDKVIDFFVKLIFLPSKRKTNKFMDEYIKKLRIIEITDDGFIITDVNKVKESEIKWYSVNDVIYDKEKVTIKMNGQDEMVVPLKFHNNWYEFIKKIPQGYPSYDYNLVELFFQNLRGCEICGLVAVDDEQECIACGNEVWNSELEKEYESKEAYLKEMQFDNFEPNNDNDKIEIHNNPEMGFESYSAWIPLINEKDYKK